MATTVLTLQQTIMDTAVMAAQAVQVVTKAAAGNQTPDQTTAYYAALAQQYADTCDSLCSALMTLQGPGPVKTPASTTNASPPSLYP